MPKSVPIELGQKSIRILVCVVLLIVLQCLVSIVTLNRPPVANRVRVGPLSITSLNVPTVHHMGFTVQLVLLYPLLPLNVQPVVLVIVEV